MTDDIHTPEILATVGHFDYIIGVLKRPRDGGAAHFYSSIEEWETTEAYQAAALQRRLDDMRRDRDAAEKKVGELILRNQAQEGTIDRLQRQLLEAQAARAATPAEAPLPALPATDPPEREESRARAVVAPATPMPISTADPALPVLPRHQKIPCGVDGCLTPMAVGAPMAAHRMRKHKAWHAAQMELGHDLTMRGQALSWQPESPATPPLAEEEPEPLPTPVPLTQVAPLPREPGPPPRDAPPTPDVIRDQQRLMLERQFASLADPPFTCSACGKTGVHAQSVSDENRCQRCVSEGRYADDAVIAVRT
jgi:hypothetical protein